MLAHFTFLRTFLVLVTNTKPVGNSPKNLLKAFSISENYVILMYNLIIVSRGVKPGTCGTLAWIHVF